MKCINCNEHNSDDNLIVLAERQLGLGDIKDYCVCMFCYENELND